MICQFCHSKLTSTDIGAVPYVLKCGHNICKKCLGASNPDQGNNAVTCKICQEVTTKEDGIYPDQYALGAMSKFLNSPLHNRFSVSILKKESQENQKTVDKCEECAKDAKWICQPCKGLYCGPCFEKVHKPSKSLRRHIPESLEGLMKTLVQDGCLVHQSRIVEFYCEKDGELVCSLCIGIGTHKEHPVVMLSDKNSTFLPELKDVRMDGLKTLKKLQNVEKKLQTDVLNKIKGQYRDQSKEVSECFSQLHGLLQRREMEVQSILKNSFQSQADLVNVKLQEVKTTISDLSCLLQDANTILKNPTATINLVILNKKLQEQGQQPSNFVPLLENTSLKFEIPDDFYHAIKTTGVIEGELKLPFDLRKNEDTPEEFQLKEEEEKEEEAPTTVSHSEENCHSEPLSILRPVTNKIIQCQDVVVTHIRNPGQFWVRRVTDKPNFAKLQLSIKDHVKSHHKSLTPPSLSDISEGQHCLVKYSMDNQWYRAQVTKILSAEDTQDEQVQVFYIDFGNSEVLTVKNLLPMEPRFKSMPSLALECRLYDLCPAETKWTKAATNTFAQFVANKNVQMKTIDLIDGVFYVDLCQTPSNEILDDTPVSVRDALVFMEMATLTTGDTKFVAGQKLKPYHNQARRRRQYYQPEPLADNQKYGVVVTYFQNPLNFYVQQLGQTAGYFSKLSYQMKERFEKDIDKDRIFVPYLGMPCVAKYSMDEQWYRARITALCGNGKVSAFYVDFGNTEEVELNRLRKIPDEFMKMPAQATRCSLIDLAPVEEDTWPPQVKDFVMEFVKDKKFYIKVHSVTPKEHLHQVSFYQMLPDSDLNIGALLVNQKFARSTGPSTARLEIVSKISAEETNGVKAKEKPPALELYIQVTVSHCENPSVIFVQSVSEKYREELADLQQALKESYQDKKSELEEIQPSTAYVIQYAGDHLFYRGLLLKELEDSLYEVKLMDYGNVVRVGRSAIHPMLPQFSAAKSFAIKCHIADISPAGGNTCWSRMASDFTTSFFLEHKQLYMDTKGELVKGSLPVDLLLLDNSPPEALQPSTNQWISFKDTLMEKGLALPSHKRKLREESESRPDSPPALVRWKPALLPTATSFRALVTHVDYQGYFHIQMVKDLDQVASVVQQLNARFGEEKADIKNGAGDDSSVEPNLRVGQACIAKFSGIDNRWYRAEVMAFHDDGVEVVFLDYGNNFLVVNPAKGISTQVLLEDLPGQCLCCELWNLVPCTSNKLWPLEILDLLHKLTVDSVCDVEVKELPIPGQPIKIILTTSNGEDIRDFLVNALKVASYIDPSLEQGMEEQVYAMLEIGEGEVGGPLIPVEVTHIASVDCIYLQVLPTPTSPWISINRRSFCQMTERLNEEGPQLPVLENPRMGSVCCALYTEDSRWYRALVVTLEEKDTAIISFVDYGNTDLVPLSVVKQLPQELFELPVQSLMCSFHRVAMVAPQDHVVEALSAILLHSDKLYAKFLTTGSSPEVELYTDDGALAYQTLLDDNTILLQ